MEVNVLGVKIDDVTIAQAVVLVEGWLSKKGKFYIVTPNPEFVMMAQKDPELKSIINNSDLAIPDGVGLKLAGIKNTVTGVELMERLVQLGSKRGFTTSFLGGRNEVAKKTAECLSKIYPNLKVTFAESGGEVDEEGELVKPVKIPKSDFLFVAFGPPKQEKWIAKNLDKIPIKVAMGVGGAFDYLSGRVPRAPLVLRNLGLEWLFRLILQPWRIKRQLVLIHYLYQLLTRGR